MVTPCRRCGRPRRLNGTLSPFRCKGLPCNSRFLPADRRSPRHRVSPGCSPVRSSRPPPPPALVYAQPILVQPPPRVVTAPQPVYLWVPPGHQKNWGKHCGRYGACGVPVYFVQDRWYREEWLPSRGGPRPGYATAPGYAPAPGYGPGPVHGGGDRDWKHEEKDRKHAEKDRRKHEREERKHGRDDDHGHGHGHGRHD